MAEDIVAGPVRDWLAANRAALNARFRVMQRRYPQLAAETVLSLCRDLLPPLAGANVASSAELFAAVYDLILLHSGRGKLPTSGGDPGLSVLFRETFPRLQPLLARSPRHLPGALSNSVENMASRGTEFARDLAGLASFFQLPDELLDTGAVVGWRLGDARLRDAALGLLPKLSPRLALAALGLAGWPPDAAPLVIAGLESHGWRRPDELWSQATLDRLVSQGTDEILSQAQKLRGSSVMRGAHEVRGRLGNFVGFGGHFEQPPLLLDDHGQGNSHRFWVKCGPDTFRIDGDAFGWTCQSASGDGFSLSAVRAVARWKPARNTTSMVVRNGLIACTTGDSFRVSILAPEGAPL